MTWSTLGIALCVLMLPVVAITAAAPAGWTMVISTSALLLLQLAAMSCFIQDERTRMDDDVDGPHEP